LHQSYVYFLSSLTGMVASLFASIFIFREVQFERYV